MTEEMLRRDVKEDIASKHTTTQTDVDSKHATTDTDIGSKHTVTRSQLKAEIASKHTPTQSKIATVTTAVGAQAAFIKQNLVHGTAPLTADPEIFTESAGNLANTGAVWTVMLSKMIDTPEAIESKVIESIFVDLGWKHRGDHEDVVTAFMTKWVASHLEPGSAIGSTAIITDSVMAPSTNFGSVHRSGAVKLAGMNYLPLKLALMGKASGAAGSLLEASLMSDSVIEVTYSI